jgi:hypothetical protein
MNAPIPLSEQHTMHPIPPVDDDDDDDDDKRKPGSGGGSIDPDDDEGADNDEDDDDDEEDTLWTLSGCVRQNGVQGWTNMLQLSIAAICELFERLPAARITFRQPDHRLLIFRSIFRAAQPG